MAFTVLFSVLFLSVGLMIGWIGNEKYMALLNKETHEFDQLFADNPHPEIFGKDGKVIKGDYTYVSFDLGYDAEEFDPDDIQEI